MARGVNPIAWRCTRDHPLLNSPSHLPPQAGWWGSPLCLEHPWESCGTAVCWAVLSASFCTLLLGAQELQEWSQNAQGIPLTVHKGLLVCMFLLVQSAVSGEPGLCLLSPFHCSTFPLLQALFSFCFKLIWPQSKQYSCKDLWPQSLEERWKSHWRQIQNNWVLQCV